MAEQLTHGQLAAKLIVEGALDQMAGKATAKFPIVGVAVDEAARAKLGCAPGGKTLFYEVAAKSGVFLDLSGSTTTVWFRDADGGDALQSFKDALKRSYPNAQQVDDRANEKDPMKRQRSFDVPLSKDRVAVVDIIFPVVGTPLRSFHARIRAYAVGERPRN